MSSFPQQKISKPKTLACYICGRQFGTRSLTLHLKSCKQKFKIQQDQKIDKSTKIKLPQQPQLLDTLLVQIENGALQEDLLQKYNQEARHIHKYKVLPSCKYCGRTFNEQALIGHLKACPKKTSSESMDKNDGYKLIDDLRKPRTLACCVCGRQFGITSLKIHYPQCKEKFKNQELKKLFKERNPTPQFSKEDEQMINQKVDWTIEEIADFNKKATQNYRNKALVHCQNCKRKFLPDSLKRHSKNCKLINGDNSLSLQKQGNFKEKAREAQEKIKKPKVLMCHICGRQFGLTSLKIHQKSCSQKWINEQQKRPKKQRRELPELSIDKNEFELNDAEKWDMDKIEKYNEAANQIYKGCALFPCSICGRKFFEESLARHFKYCQKNAEEKKLKQESRSLSRSKEIQSSSQMNSFKQNLKQMKQNKLTAKCDQNNNSSQKLTDSNQSQTIRAVQMKSSEAKQSNKQDQLPPQSKNFNSTINQENEQLQSTLKQNSNTQQALKQQKQQNPSNKINDLTNNNEEASFINRVECSKCGRKFAEDRIAKHQSICKAMKKGPVAKQQNIQSQATRANRNVSIDQKKERPESNNTKTNLMKLKSTKQAIQSQNNQKLKKPTEKDFSQKNQNTNQLQECSKCGKKFMPSKLQKHLSKCKDVVFKTKNKQNNSEKISCHEEVLESEKQPPKKELNTTIGEKDKKQDKSNKITQTRKQQILPPQAQKNEIKSELVTCKYCKRRFGVDRIEKHQNVCLNKKAFEEKQQSSQLQNLKSKDSKNNKIKGFNPVNKETQSAKAPPVQQRQKQAPAQIKENTTNLVNEETNIVVVPCQKCGRKFANNRIQKHQTVCKGTVSVNKKEGNSIQPSNHQNVDKNSQLQLHNMSKTPQNSKKNCFNIKKLVKKSHQQLAQKSQPEIVGKPQKKIASKHLPQISKHLPQNPKNPPQNIKHPPQNSQHLQIQKAPYVTQSQIQRKQAVKENLQITERLINEIWDSKQSQDKLLFINPAKFNGNQKAQKLIPNVYKTAVEGGFYRKNHSKQVSQQKQALVEDDEIQDFDRIECKKCGRKFVSDRISKHQQICKGSTIPSTNQNHKLSRYNSSKNKKEVNNVIVGKKEQISQSIAIPEPKNIITQFKQIKKMKINQSLIDLEIQREMNVLNLKKPVNDIKSSGFSARSTFGGGDKFYSIKQKSVAKMQQQRTDNNLSNSSSTNLVKKWFQ